MIINMKRSGSGILNEEVACPNCGTPRHIDEEGYVEKCPNCGDDEWNIYSPTPQVP